MVLVMEPIPATSTTFSCQLRSTLMAAWEGSAAPGLPPTWLNPPVDWGVTLLGVLEDDDPDAIPL